MAEKLKGKEPIRIKNNSFDRKRVFLFWGIIILICVPLLFILFKQIVSTISFNPNAVIKDVKTFQTEGAVVGKPIKWTAIVNLKDIKSGEHLVEIPKSAKNVKVKTVTAKEAKESANIKDVQLTLGDKKSLAYGLNNSLSSSLGLSVKMFFAEAESVAQAVVESVTAVPDSQAVDVSSQITEQASVPVEQVDTGKNIQAEPV